MAIDLSGQGDLIKESAITIKIEKTHPLILLANALPWLFLMNLVAEDLKKTTRKGFWWMGRKLKVRIHLGAYLLQRIYNLTDRKTEYGLKDNAAYQLFCGSTIVDDWHTLDHTKIQEFRNRLSPETQRELANTISQTAVKLGFADPREVDFDSTVQEANISYPSDASLMTKLSGIGKKVVDYLQSKLPNSVSKGLAIDMKSA